MTDEFKKFTDELAQGYFVYFCGFCERCYQKIQLLYKISIKT